MVIPPLIIILFVVLIGILAGTITGLIPGIHTNLIAIFILASLAFLLDYFTPFYLTIFIVVMAITHTFVDFIPAIFLGAPNEDTALSVIPGHEFLLKGKAYQAIILTLIGSVSAIIILIFITPLFIWLIPKIYPSIQKMMAWFLIWISIFLISQEKDSKTSVILIFMLAGFLGLATLNLPVKQPLFAMLTGLFGSSTLIFSISQNIQIPKQDVVKPLILKKQIIKPILITAIISPICSFFPGLGSSQAAIIGSKLTKKISKPQFLILLGSINTLVMAVSFVTLFLINKSRTGAANAIQQIIELTIQDLVYILIIVFITSLIASFIVVKIAKKIAKNIHLVNYKLISYCVISLLIFFVLIFSGWLGFLVFSVSTCLGLTCIYLGIRRGYLMGCLLIPTIIFYLPFF